jgi:hypothetical protein
MDNELQAEIAKKFLTPEKFAVAIERIVKENNVNYIDAIVLYCEVNSIEIDTIPKLISKPLKEKLKRDAMELNFMKKTTRARLPL